MFRIDRPQPRPYEPVAEAEAPRAWRVVMVTLALGTCAAGVILLQVLGAR